MSLEFGSGREPEKRRDIANKFGLGPSLDRLYPSGEGRGVIPTGA